MAFFRQELAIDLGTANTVIFKDGKVVLDEPSIIAIESKTEKVVALGKQAQNIEERSGSRIYTTRPLMNGVIADYDAAEKMLSGFIKRAAGRRRGLLSPSLRVVIGIPGGSTPVDKRSIRDSSSHAGAREVYMIYEPMASALGIGLDVGAYREIGTLLASAVVPAVAQGTVQDGHLRVEALARVFHISHTAFGSDVSPICHSGVKYLRHLPELPEEEEPGDYVVLGRNVVTAHPAEATISYHEVSSCIDKTISKIEGEIIKVLQRTPPELYSDIVRNGIWLAGGGAMLRGLARRFSDKVNIVFRVAEDPLKAVARGTCLALRGVDSYPFMMR